MINSQRKSSKLKYKKLYQNPTTIKQPGYLWKKLEQKEIHS